MTGDGGSVLTGGQATRVDPERRDDRAGFRLGSRYLSVTGTLRSFPSPLARNTVRFEAFVTIPFIEGDVGHNVCHHSTDENT